MSKNNETMQSEIDDLNILIQAANTGEAGTDRIKTMLRAYAIKRGYRSLQLRAAHDLDCVDQLKDFYGLK